MIIQMEAGAHGNKDELLKQAAAILLLAEHGERYLDSLTEPQQLELLDKKLRYLKTLR